MRYLQKRNGITSIEILLVLGLFVIVVAGSFPFFSSFQTNSRLSDVSDRFVLALKQTQQDARYAKYGHAHGVFLGVNQYITYAGNSFVQRDPQYDSVVPFSDDVQIISQLGTTDIQFAQGTGFPIATGTIQLFHDVSGQYTITLSQNGIISIAYSP